MKATNTRLNLILPAKINASSLSFIIPAMNEEQTLEELYYGIRAQAEKLAPVWEVIFIDDGSTDSTWSKMQELARKDPQHVRSLRFRHNRGKADALALGYRESKGQIVFTMDADLQDPPELIAEMVRVWRTEGAQVVLATASVIGELPRGQNQLDAQLNEFVTDDHPISTGAAPAAPPITMLRSDVRFSHRVYTPM